MKPNKFCNFVSMKNNKDIETLIKGGLIGSGLGALLSKDKEDGAIIGALLGAVFAATKLANQRAKEINSPIYEVIDGKLYKILPNRERQLIRELPKTTKIWEEEFNLI